MLYRNEFWRRVDSKVLDLQTAIIRLNNNAFSLTNDSTLMLRRIKSNRRKYNPR